MGEKVDSVIVVDKVKTEDRHRMKGKIGALIASDILNGKHEKAPTLE